MTKSRSTTFLKNQEEVLSVKKKKLLANITQLAKDDPFRDPERVNDNASIDTEVREQENHHLIESKIRDMKRIITAIDRALEKISRKTYGYCEKCNSEIVQARLDVLPEAQYCVKCENRLRK